MAGHIQVPFVTARGLSVEVDEGMLDILRELSRLGVETQYSCQGLMPEDENYGFEDPGAYVLADHKTFWPLLRKIYIRWRLGHYSPASMRFVSTMMRSYHEVVLNWYTEEGTNHRQKLNYSRGWRRPNRRSVEWSWSNHYGRRITVRWPTESASAILQLLRETR